MEGIEFSPQVVAEILEDRSMTMVRAELSLLVDEGFLNMGVDPDTGDTLWWPTERGIEELGMVKPSYSS